MHEREQSANRAAWKGRAGQTRWTPRLHGPKPRTLAIVTHSAPNRDLASASSPPAGIWFVGQVVG